MERDCSGRLSPLEVLVVLVTPVLSVSFEVCGSPSAVCMVVCSDDIDLLRLISLVRV